MFDPKALGFTEVTNGFGCDSKMRSVCYLHISRTRKTREVNNIRIVLDDVTTSIARGMLGDRCGVAIDDNARIVLYNGSSRKIMFDGKAPDRGKISLDAERRKLLAILGTSFTNYEYEAKMWAKGEAILLTPKGVIR